MYDKYVDIYVSFALLMCHDSSVSKVSGQSRFDSNRNWIFSLRPRSDKNVLEDARVDCQTHVRQNFTFSL